VTAALVLALLAGGDIPKTRPDAPRPTISALEGNITSGSPFVWPPKPALERGAFWTRTTKVEAGVMAGIAVADQVQTCRNLRRRGGHYWHEDELTQSCAGNVALTAAFDAGAVALAWGLHRTGHNRLAKLPMAYMAAASARGITW